MNRITPTVLVCDVDNTIYDFVDYYGRAFRAMEHVVSKQTGKQLHEVREQFKNIYRVAGALDFKNLIRNLDLSKAMPDDELEKLVQAGRRAFDLSKRKRLVPYAGMDVVLEAICAADVTIVAVTNAPFYHAYTRLRDVRLLEYFSGLVAWEGVRLEPKDYLFDEGHQQQQDAVFQKAMNELKLFSVFKKAESKPNDYSFKLVYDYFGDADYFAIGDSISKDLLPTIKFGMKTIWAKYGTVVQNDNLDTVLAITPWDATEIVKHSEQTEEPDYVAEDPFDILEIVPNHYQMELLLR